MKLKATISEFANNYLHWLYKTVFPYWLDNGIDRTTGYFTEYPWSENIKKDSQKTRMLVVFRQIYSFCYFYSHLGTDTNKDRTEEIIKRNARVLYKAIESCSTMPFFIEDLNSSCKKYASPYFKAFALLSIITLYKTFGEPLILSYCISMLSSISIEGCIAFSAANLGSNDEKVCMAVSMNSLMHLYEALLLCETVDNVEIMVLSQQLTAEIEKFLLTSQIISDKSIIPEYISISGSEIPENLRWQELGHQYEWVSLLMSRGGDKELLELRNSIFMTTLKHDNFRILPEKQDLLGNTLDNTSRIWAQLERCRTLALMYCKYDLDSRYYDHVHKSFNSLLKYLNFTRSSLWHENTNAIQGNSDRLTVKATSLYHIVSLAQTFESLDDRLSTSML